MDNLPHYTTEELIAMANAAQEQGDESAYQTLRGIIDTREADNYAQDQEE